ncbi:hypothetical protein COV88_02790 [Candidatus Saccharibacteria bacterium CG11_big_fil_rev_8_21_14_0_20_41_19]|nr:hypothetical protein [Candidatus Saccharibacteria bacterium]OIP85997.1 MAG: hypothetical protein AUK57_01605 [Candidatus Saccharibacteria bacterium CG2_30_41_52]PIQ70814.1 MAG: hypothetical protein COV88_02790 [Candidatus Saccharibacteria bacterium CG11_big_fil_rev_8_21_14_0_20_41_19]PIZ60101.1 MAG: hypothetical protein COY18_01955 [Candidatus Saccharibacteria bacterium CG_4_10_14_0_2_um_filter_41_11]PJC29548.1 MAG: hypothetical protein CO052_02835 [Candidatus Saccharibacteria bacterium CG_4
MRDLDFDELDRAVNSLITSAPVATNNDLPEKTLELEPGSPEDLITASTTSQPAAVVVTPSIASPMVARRSTGRFMDVVPPSSSTRVAVAAPERVSREGATIAPVAPIVSAPVEPAPEPVETPAIAQKNDWPDPIDFKGLDLNENPEKLTVEPVVEDNEDADIDQINNEITNTMNQSVSESLDSPFISGTKVEKRPLGAFSDGSTAATVQPEPTADLPTLDSSSLSTEGIATVVPATPFPAELSEDLLSIESGESVEQLAAVEAVATPAAGPVEAASVLVAEPVVAAPVAPTITVADNQSTTSNSISQQYTEQPSSGDQTTGAIYDTDAYHKALVTPSNKKSSWLWVLWIVILLVVGAGAGAVVYFFVLPSL